MNCVANAITTILTFGLFRLVLGVLGGCSTKTGDTECEFIPRLRVVVVESTYQFGTYSGP